MTLEQFEYPLIIYSWTSVFQNTNHEQRRIITL